MDGETITRLRPSAKGSWGETLRLSLLMLVAHLPAVIRASGPLVLLIMFLLRR